MIVIIRLVIEMNNDGDDNSDRDNDDDDDECNQCLLKLSHGGTAMSDDK